MNKQNILKQMEAVVKDVMTRNQELDFYTCDTKTINGLESEESLMIWACGQLSTHMFSVRDAAEGFTTDSYDYWVYMDSSVLPLQFLWDGHTLENHHFFLIESDGIRKVSRSQIKEIVRDTITPVIERIKAENGGKLPMYQGLA